MKETMESNLLNRIRRMRFGVKAKPKVKDNKCIICNEPLLNLRAKYCSECKCELWRESSKLQKRKKANER